MTATRMPPTAPPTTPPPVPAAAPPSPRPDLRVLVGVVVVGLLLALPWSLLGLRPVLTAILLGLPVLVVVRRVRWHSEGVLRPFLLGYGLVLLGLMVVGLVVNTVLPWVGVDRPLARPVVAVVVTLTVIGLLLWRRGTPLTSTQELCGRLEDALALRFEPAVTLAALGLLAGIVGAIRLNNGAGGAIALLGHVLVLGALALLLVRRTTQARDATVIYLSSTALLLATSLRSWFVIGHDIQQEYIVYQLTQAGDHWSMSLLPGAYNACLSLNILPTMLANLTGLSGLVIFKVVMPLVFGLVPIIVFAIARAFVGRFAALLGTIVFVAFPTFANDMTYLVRQEVAFLLVALAVMVGVHRDLGQRPRQILVIVLSVGVVLSHYSTTYVLIISLVVALAAQEIERRRRARREDGDAGDTARDEAESSGAVLLKPVTVGVLVLTTFLWVVPATHSGGHLSDTLTTTVSSLLHGDLGVGSSDLGYSIVPGQKTSPQQRLDLYASTVQKTRETSKGPWLIRTPTSADLHPVVAPPGNAPLTGVGHALADTGLGVSQTNALLRLGTALLLQVWLLIGLVLLVRRRVGPEAGEPTGRAIPREGTWLAVGSLASIGLLVALPGLSADYGVLRTVQQSLILTAPAVAIGALWTLHRLGRRTRAVAAGALVAIALVLTGVVSTVTGGFPGALPLASSGQYYDLYFTSQQDQAGLEWVAREVPSVSQKVVVSADPASVPRLIVGGRGRLSVSSNFYPTLLQPGQWVFLDSVNLDKGQAHALYGGGSIAYLYPVQQVRDRLNVVYSGPSSQVLR